MKTSLLSLLIGSLALLLSSCQPQANANGANSTSPATTASEAEDEPGLSLLKSRCVACHGVGQKTHDQLIAPPLIAMKRRYFMVYPEKAAFVAAMAEFVRQPSQETALMYGAINRFGLMAPLPLPTGELEQIAAYIFDTEMEKPAWFEAHFQEMHPDGIPD